MNNEQVQGSIQPMQSGQVVQSVPSMPPVQPGASGMMNRPPASTFDYDKKDNSGKTKTIVAVLASLVAVIFIVLFIWMTLQYNEVNNITQAQIDAKIAEAVYQQQQEDLEKFNEEEKYPYRSFVGPVDYGQLSFEYPKTWSVYIASDASKGGDYQAYLNPLEVNAISNSTVYALRVTIRNRDFEDVVSEYQRYVERNDYDLSMETVEVAGTTANRYVGAIPNTEFTGVIVIFKIRDKTAILQTDAMTFANDFNNILNTLQFNA